MSSIVEVWGRLRDVGVVRFKSKSYSGIGWSGIGAGLVKVSEPADNVLIFSESGSWHQEGGQKLTFSNVFRWSRLDGGLRLEHLRFGYNNPVFLFDMAEHSDGIWREIIPHPCSDDCYRASLCIQHEQIFVQWLVRGPKRDEVIDYVYT